MKKFYLLLTACLLAFAGISAQTALKIQKFATQPTIDGVIDASWAAVPQQDIKKADATYKGTVNEAWFKMGWVDTAIVLLVYIDDDGEYCPQWCTGLANWQSDRAEIYFWANEWPGTTAVGAKTANKGIYQYTSDMPYGTDTLAKYSGYNAGLYQEAIHIEGNVYTMEFCFPFYSLKDSMKQDLTPTNGKQFGFDIYFLDRDEKDKPVTSADDSKRRWVYWNSATGGAWDDLRSAGTMEFSTSLVSAKSTELNSFSVSPNPAADNIQISGSKVTDVELYNGVGQLVIKQSVNNNNVNVANLRSGLYILKAYNNKSVVGQVTVIKK